MATSRTIASALGVAALGLLLSGCSIEEYVVNSHEESFGTYAAAAEDWVGGEMPEWIPTDATGIRRIATNDGRISTIRIETKSAPRGACEEQPREGVPVLTARWSAAERPDSVLVCGDYEIMPTENGWLGWLYNPEEPGRLS